MADLIYFIKVAHFPQLRHTSNGNFLTKGRSKVNLKFFEYSNSNEYLAAPGVVDYDKKKMAKPVYDLILGCGLLLQEHSCDVFVCSQHEVLESLLSFW